MTENKKCTVLQIGSYFLGTRLFSILHKKLNENGIESFTYTPCSDKTYRGWNMNEDDYKNVIISNCFNQRDRLFFFKKADKIFYDIEKRLDFKKITCVYAHSVFSAGYPAYKIKKKYNVPYVVSVCNSDVNRFFKYCFWLRPLGEKIIINAEKTVFVSDSYKDFVCEKYIHEKNRQLFISKCETIPFGIDDFWINNRCKKENIDGKNLTIVSTGRVEPNKNQIKTAEACKILQDRGYDVKLKLIGSITDNGYFKKVKAFPFCEYLGVKTYEEMKEIYKSCDILVLPSIHETFGLVYGEAMSCGLPVIYTKGQGFDRQFPDGDVGYAVSSDSAEEIADAILKTLKNYGNVRNNAFVMCKKFDWNIIAKKYIELFEDIN